MITHRGDSELTLIQSIIQLGLFVLLNCLLILYILTIINVIGSCYYLLLESTIITDNICTIEIRLSLML